MATERRWLKKVFRVQDLPNNISTCQEAAKFIARCLSNNGRETGVKVYSVATTLEYWETPLSKVATAQLDESIWPSAKAKSKLPEQWEAGCIRLDTHFLGMTPLNDVESSKHKFDCIAISGLASHPFGSWQPRGEDKSFMWIRDELPAAVPGVRAIVYGYDSKLSNSNSFQTIHDIAIMFAEQIHACFPGVPPRPLIFLAHSLGGIVLKDAIMEMARVPDIGNEMMKKIHGAIMFGVPHLGMDQSHLAVVVKDQPNETLVQDLSPNSPYLKKLNDSFSGISLQGNMKMVLVYETMKSETVQLKDGVPVRSEQTTISVSPISATGLPENGEGYIRISVNESHSGMVKYDRGHPACRAILQRLRDICSSNDASPQNFPGMQWAHRPYKMGAPGPESASSYLSHLRAQRRLKARERIYQEFLKFLDAPSLDSRREDIDPAFKNTFEWVFALHPFTNWLQDGTGIFWINGKPGSGKSTLMKYIFEHQQTQQLVHSCGNDAKQIFAGFFFHFRGNAIQKSFEGLLRSLLKQILEEEPGLLDELLPLITVDESLEQTKFLSVRPSWSIFNLKERLQRILSQKSKRLGLVLFFDALDEFDGHPEAICRFLEELVKQPGDSMTRIRVCFSSRPWEVFTAHFDNCLKITIQEHTRDDIRDYYLGMVSDFDLSLSEMVPEVVERASGVFLWVRLLIRELTSSSSSEDVRTRFLAFPDELDQFYEITINRIPLKYRWEAFVLLETMMRAVENRDKRLRILYCTVLISRCQTSTEARNKIDKALSSHSRKDMWKDILLWSGGLVEMDGTEDTVETKEDGGQVKMMHQTVYDFVSSVRFKELVLGPIAKITHDNGYTFLAKSRWVLGTTGERGSHLSLLTYYARQSESTTGRSNLEFYTPDFQCKRKRGQVVRTEGMFFFAGLIIFLRELVELDSSFLEQQRKQPFLFLIFIGFAHIGSTDVVAMVELLRNHNYPMRRDIPAILAFIGKGFPFPHFNYFYLHSSLPEDHLFKVFLDQVGDIIFHNRNDLDMELAIRDEYVRPDVFHVLHYAGPETTEALLRLGCDPDVLDSENRSSLDYSLHSSSSSSLDEVIKDMFRKCCVLVRAGSVALSLDEEEVHRSLYAFDKHGYDTAFLRERLSNILQNRPMESSWELLKRKGRRVSNLPKIAVALVKLQKALFEVGYQYYLDAVLPDVP